MAADLPLKSCAACNMVKSIFASLFLFSVAAPAAFAQSVSADAKVVEMLTAEWKGERFPDGRPKVSDQLLERLKAVGLEEAWNCLKNRGYNNQFEGGWTVVHPDAVMTGRALTAQYLPLRPDAEAALRKTGVAEGRNASGGTNSWPIDALSSGDVYVADGFGKIAEGTLIGDMLANAIYKKSQRGVIFNGSVRDLKGISQVEGFNGWVKGYDPSYLKEVMLASINQPVRIGRATVLPGDAVLAARDGVLFIPAQLLEEVVVEAEFISLRDAFGKQRITEGIYKAGDIDSAWTPAIREDFLEWLKKRDGLPMSREELEKYLSKRTW